MLGKLIISDFVTQEKSWKSNPGATASPIRQ